MSKDCFLPIETYLQNCSIIFLAVMFLVLTPSSNNTCINQRVNTNVEHGGLWLLCGKDKPHWANPTWDMHCVFINATGSRVNNLQGRANPISAQASTRGFICMHDQPPIVCVLISGAVIYSNEDSGVSRARHFSRGKRTLVEEGLAGHARRPACVLSSYFGLERWKPAVCLGGRGITVCGATCWAEAGKSRRTSKPGKIKRNLDFSKDLKKERRVSQWARLLYGDFYPFSFFCFSKDRELKTLLRLYF